MDDRAALMQALDGLLQEVQRLRVGMEVQRSALVTLALHAAPTRLRVLAKSLVAMAETQPDEGWREGHQELVAALRELDARRTGLMRSQLRRPA